MKRDILSVFRTYCDCYLEFVNNFISGETFCEFYELDEAQWLNVVKAVAMVRAEGGKWCEIDYYYNICTNGTFSEKGAIY